MDQEAQARARRVAQRKARQDRNLFGRMQAAAAASRAQAQRFLKAGGELSILEWRVMWDLEEAGPLTVRDIANIQRSDHSLISRALPAMRARGYVVAVPGAQDGRRTLIALTEAGRAAFKAAAPVMQARRAGLRGVFTEAEVDTFVDLLDRFEAHLALPVPSCPTLPEQTS